MRYLLIILCFISLLFSNYQVGDQISEDDQNMEFQICYGDEQCNENDGLISLSNLNGDGNGGDYYVTMIVMNATWDGPSWPQIEIMAEIINHYKDDLRVKIITNLDDIDQPYSCQQWGDRHQDFQDIIPLITDDGSQSIIFDWLQSGSSYPSTAYLDHNMNVYYKANIPDFSIATTTIDAMLVDCGDLCYGEDILGCTDELACNYNCEANEDNGSCEYKIDDGIWYVSEEGDDNNCGSEAYPFFSIQTGINNAEDGDEVFVSEGTYYEKIYITKNILLKGEDTNNTIIDGNNELETLVTISASSTFQNFTITKGVGESHECAYDGQADPLLPSALLINGGSSIISNCIIRDNDTGRPISNSADILFLNTLIYNNSETICNLENFDVINSTIDETISLGYNSGVYALNSFILDYYSYETFTTSIVTEYCNYNNFIDSMESSCVDEGGWYCNGYYSQTNDISEDPQFIDPENGDYSLQSSSPFIDAGHPDTDGDGIDCQTDTDDQDPDGTRKDVGAFYHECTQEIDCAAVCDGDSTIDVCGVCDADSLNDNLIDCNNDLCGEAIIDDCGVCTGGNTDYEFNELMDCSGQCFGDAAEDDCGDCNGNIFFGDNIGEPCDCSGDVLDECYVCGGDGPDEGYDCDGNCIVETDCNGVCGGDSYINECGECIKLDIYDFNELMDCQSDFTNDDLRIVLAREYPDGCFEYYYDLFYIESYDVEIGIPYNLSLEELEYINIILNNGYEDESVTEASCNGCSNLDAINEIGDNQFISNFSLVINSLYDEWGGLDFSLLITVINSDQIVEDCNGVCGGDGTLDYCGTCDNNLENDCLQDCEGIWGGDAVIDECGICDGGGPDEGYDCDGNCIVETDCNGDCGGSAVIDDCGLCTGGNTDYDFNELMDCEGVCYGDSVVDECGICNGDGNSGTWYVSVDEDDSNCGSESQPVSSIQHAIDLAEEGDTIYIFSGHYFENINYIEKGLTIIGENRENTIIDANYNGRAIDGITDNTHIKSLTIQNGLVEWTDGGVMYLSEEENITFEDCIFKNNNAVSGGGNAFRLSSNASPEFNNCVFVNEIDWQTSGTILMRNNTNAHPIFNNCQFLNTAEVLDRHIMTIDGYEGSSIYEFNNCYFENADTGIFLYDSQNDSVIINQCVFNNNKRDFSTQSEGDVNVSNCTFYSEIIPSENNEIYSNSNLEISNSIFWGRADAGFTYYFSGFENISANYSLIPSPEDYGIENIYTDPQFVNPDNKDFNLQVSSLCVDTGDPESELDPDGTRADMGAFYYDQIENPIIYGCMDEEACNYDEDANINDESCLYCGCMDENAINYDENATIDDDTCIYASDLQKHYSTVWEGMPNNPMGLYINTVLIDENDWDPADEIAVFDGDLCVGMVQFDPNLNNTPTIYASEDDPNTEQQDGFIAGNSMTFQFWDYSQQIEVINIISSDENNIFVPLEGVTIDLTGAIIYGCMDESACNYNENSTVEGECIYIAEDECDCDGNILDECEECGGNGIQQDCGCGPDGTLDLEDLGWCDCDGSVLDECGICDGDNSSCSGCTDQYAINYDENATIDDETCEYPETGDLNNDTIFNISDVIMMINYVLNNEYVFYADLNEDDYLNILDILILVNWILE